MAGNDAMAGYIRIIRRRKESQAADSQAQIADRRFLGRRQWQRQDLTNRVRDLGKIEYLRGYDIGAERVCGTCLVKKLECDGEECWLVGTTGNSWTGKRCRTGRSRGHLGERTVGARRQTIS